MRIAMFVYEFPPKIVGGLGTYAAEISQQFVRMGHDVTVFTMNDSTLLTRETWHGVEIHRPMLVEISDILPALVAEDLRKWGRGIKFFSNIFVYNILAASKLVNDLVKKEQLKFDIISAHDWLSVIAGASVKRELNIPLVFHVHSTEKGRAMDSGSSVVNSIEFYGGEISDRVVTVSFAMRDELLGLGFPEQNVRVCYNGVDPNKYDQSRVKLEDVNTLRKKYSLRESDNMVFFVGRLTSVKGVDRLVMAMPEVLRKLPNTKLVIVGLGEMQKHLTSLVNSLGLQNSVILRFEFLPEEERILHYAACNAAVFPSLYEPFGIVCLEAMSMGKPVVVGARGTSGLREQIIPSGPEQCGFHVNPHDPSDLAWGIVSLLADPVAASRFGENARNRVLKYFSLESVAKSTLAVYEELLGK